MVRKIKKVLWYDITAHHNNIVKKPFKNYLCKRWTIGYVQNDKDAYLVEYSNDEDGCASFDVIPKNCVYKIEDIK
jgi:hypothetical protein